MARELSPRELDDLLGAFALDAVDGDEREQVEQYLRHSPRARAVVAEYRETAAFLADAGSEAPAGLWERIEERLAEQPSPPAASAQAVPFRPRRRTRTRRITVAAAAAAAVMVVALGALVVKVVQQDDRISDLARDTERSSLLAAADAASRNPSATKVRLSSPDGSQSARVVYLPGGAGFVVPGNLAPLSPDLVYQLWAQVGDPRSPRTISAGVLGSDPDVSTFRVPGPVVGFAISEERSPGAVSPESPPVAQGSVN
jgi:anti-sigma-K factor RskA